MEIQTIILAAGKGSRMKSDLPKVVHQLAGKPLVQHVIDSCQLMGATHAHLVVGHGADLVKHSVKGGAVEGKHIELSFSLQEEQLGTGHAVKMAFDNLKDDSPTLILYGDVPLIHHETLAELVDVYNNNPTGIALMTCDLDDPTGYGRIVRNDNGEVTGIVEHKDSTEAQKSINEINTGILCCNSTSLKDWIGRLKNDNAQGEFYLTDIIAMAVDDGNKVETAQPNNLYEIEGINTLKQLADLERVWQRTLADQLMDKGVTLRDPNRFDLRGKLTCEAGVIIDINCIIEGDVVLKKNVRIDSNVTLINSTIGENSHVKANTIIEDSLVESNCGVGPFARIRPGTHLHNKAQVGNFVEIKKVTLGEGSKAGHLSYLGDAEIGKNVNIGAGTITCNYDGANKHKTIIKDGAFIGSDSQLVAPIIIGANVTIGAGTTVASDVNDNALCISRVKQKHIDGWNRPVKK
ncbi:MAG: UDP-N-acetylglucosamine diphosphorylase/glucosamine-1-phosphate N-acetyltransferase [Kangiella sp.]|nr:MAG: UDP-N-acetylglucosamine diphosphorylase/glucosamine-1-phosphate N-acetyltransferase [Kangiella sp.]